MKIAYIRPDIGVPVDDTGLIREVDQDGVVRYRNSDGQLHRVDGPAIEWEDGSHEWYLHGRLHRVDGPAIERSNSSREWWLNGELHREDGPAVEYPGGSREWYLGGKWLSEDEFEDHTPARKIDDTLSGSTGYLADSLLVRTS